MPRIRIPMYLTLLAVVMATAPGCATSPEDSGSGLDAAYDRYPTEKTVIDFPGLSYPTAVGPLPVPGASGGPVWLVGIDGATWSMIRPMVERGELPHFAAMIERGAHGTMLSEEPTISPALWDLVGAAGGTSAVVGWFGSYPAEPIDGIYVSKGFDPENLRPEQVHPSAFRSTLSDRARVRLRPEDVREIARNASLQRSLVTDARVIAALRTIVDETSPNLVVVYFSGLDVAQHLAWRHMDPATQAFPQDGPADSDLACVIPAYYRFIDHTLGEIRALAPDDATVFVVSDHGAGPMRPEEAYHFQLEVLLQTLGLMDGERGLALAIGELYRYDKSIWLNLAGIEPSGTVAVEDAGARASEIEDRLAALRTDDDEPVFESIVRHVGESEWQPGDPALTVRFSRAALWTEAVHEGGRVFDFAPVRLRHADVSGSHRLEGIVLVEGPGIRPGPLTVSTLLYQVAPTVLYLLGLPQDSRMLGYAPVTGGVLEAVIDPERLRTHPPRQIAEYPGTGRSARLRSGARPLDVDDPARQESLEKLRSLGYIR